MTNPTLTEREEEIARLVSQGLANKVVASRLGIAEGTVKLHLNRVYRKLNIHSRLRLALHAINGGVL